LDGGYTRCHIDDEAGTIGFKQEVAEGAVSGSGVLVTITFRGKTPGTSTVAFDPEFDADGVRLENYDGDEIGATTQGGSVIVIEESPQPTQTATLEAPAATPTPTFETPEPSATPTPFPTATTAGVLYYRAMQVWPDRSIGVASGQLESTSSSFVAFPFGVYAAPTGEIVTARTYLHFPLDVFPPGTEILHATLYVYVDSAAGEGAATFGVYRALEPWSGGAWGSVPRGWPTLLPSPIALTTTFTFTVSAMAGRKPLLAALPAAASDSLAGPEAALFVVPTATPPASVLGTPVSPLATPTPSMPTAAATARPTASPSPTLPRTPGAAVPVVTLRQVTGTWLTWDVTALARAWLSREVADYGLALAAAPNPDAGPEAAGNLLLARAFTADDPLTRPYLIVQVAVHPVTPTPVPVVLLPRAGNSPARHGGSITLLAAGAILVMLGLMLRSKWRMPGGRSRPY